MSIELKIKVVSLADEAKRIRREEQRLKSYGPIRYGTDTARDFWNLRRHRTAEIRPEARAALLAYGFLRGMPYRRIEATTKTAPNWDTVKRLVKKYGKVGEVDRLEEWQDA